MPDKRGKPPLTFGDPDGAHWSADRGFLDGLPDEDDPPHVEGPDIRFMWDYGVSVPLWADGTLLPEEPEWLCAALGLSGSLVGELAAWGEAMNRLDTSTKSAATEAEYAELDLQARSLVDRVQHEVGPNYRIIYKPW